MNPHPPRFERGSSALDSLALGGPSQGGLRAQAEIVDRAPDRLGAGTEVRVTPQSLVARSASGLSPVAISGPANGTIRTPPRPRSETLLSKSKEHCPLMLTALGADGGNRTHVARLEAWCLMPFGHARLVSTP